MKVFGIIAEYNPFHNGHKFQVEQARNMGATHIVAVMSGSFVQRGQIASFDKWTRAKAALLSGVDLVVELGVPFCVSSAERFSFAGVEILSKMGCVEAINFGSESGNIELLQNVAKQVLLIENSLELKTEMKKGICYPKARENVMRNIYGDEVAYVLSTPNNILAVEYIKAINSLDSTIKPTTIKRTGVEHDSQTRTDTIASATAIRSMLAENNFDAFVPQEALNAYDDAIREEEAPVNEKKLEIAILYRLRTMTKNEIANLPDVNEGLENRIYEAARKAKTLIELFALIKSKRYTLSRIRRIIYCALLGITKSDLKLSPEYIRVLGATKKGTEILKKMKKTCQLPIIMDFSSLNEKNSRLAELEEKATDIFFLCTPKTGICGNDYYKSAIII